MGRLVYVIGVPGVGKSTAVALALGPAVSMADEPVPHLVHERGWVQLGRVRDAFSGTDALAFHIQPAVCAWLQSPEAPPRLLAEGDRLANATFFRNICRAGWDLTLVYLQATPATVAARRVARGATPDQTWLRGRETKVQRLVQGCEWPLVVVPADGTPAGVAAHLTAVLEREHG